MSERKTVGEQIDMAVSDAAYAAGHDSMTARAHAASSAFGDCMKAVRAAIPGLWDAEIVRVQRAYGKIRAVGLANSDGDLVFPEPYQRIIVLPLEEKEDDSR